MKKGIFVVLSLILLTACDISTKGSWSEEDKALAQAEVDKIDKELDYLGEHKQAFIDCYLEKAEANYSSFKEADADAPGCEKLALECSEEIMAAAAGSSEKGNWSEGDMKELMKVMAELEGELTWLGEDTKTFLDCYVDKIVDNYDSFLAANVDGEGCEAISEECLAELGY